MLYIMFPVCCDQLSAIITDKSQKVKRYLLKN